MRTEIEAAGRWSSYLRQRLSARPELRSRLEQDITQEVDPAFCQRVWQEALTLASVETDPIAQVRCSLRLLREHLFCRLMVRDIASLATLEEVTGAMSWLAEHAVAQAYRVIAHDQARIFGAPIDPLTGREQELLILGMGKLGGEELNVSSDIDLILLYSDEGETQGPRKISNHEFHARVTQRMMPVLSEHDAWGHVFRTDLRLRPDGDSGPLAWSLGALEAYLVRQGREWERYAWIKARPLAAQAFEASQSDAAWRELEGLRRSFVYRKYLDFDALAALRALRERIREDWSRRSMAPTGSPSDARDNVKLGPGGIREIEFIVQLFQLVRGGRLPTLQERSLLGALHAERELGLLPTDTAWTLDAAYRYLRKLEHRLQYRDDQQTHLLPEDPEVRSALAEAMGHADRPQFERTLKDHRELVHDLFRNVFREAGMESAAKSGTAVAQPADALSNPFRSLEPQFGDALDTLQRRVDDFLHQPRLRGLPDQSRQRVTALLPSAIAAAAETEDPPTALGHLLDLIETVASRSAYLALMAEFPETLRRVARLVAASPEAARLLLRQPLLLDDLIDDRLREALPSRDALGEQLSKQLDACSLDDGSPDVERQMNLMREWRQQITFHLLSLDLDGQLDVRSLGDRLTELADLMIEETLRRVWPLIPHKGIETPRLAVVAYGKAGGKELGYAADLDLVFLYDDDHPNAQEVYTRLVQRFSTWMQSLTSAGRLYEIDLRLRPDGDAGLLVTSTAAFRTYQLEKAWPWEHQAITRARWCAGHPAAGHLFEHLRQEVLLLERDPSKLRDAILEMREKIHDGHPNSSGLFDLKHDSGGMVDVEFVTQFLVLAHAREHRELLNNLGNMALLGLAADARLMEPELASRAAHAYATLRTRQHQLKLRGAEKARVSHAELIAERQVIQTLWNRLLAH